MIDKFATRIGLAVSGLFCPFDTAWAQAPAPSGTVINIAGNGLPGFSGDGGSALTANLNGPKGAAIGPDGMLYFIDAGNYRIRAIDPVTGIITTIAGNGDISNTGNDGPAIDAAFSGMDAIAVDRARNALYIGELDNNWVRKVDLTTGLLTRYAGSGINGFGFSGDGGPATLAEFSFVDGVATDAAGKLAIADVFSNRVRRVDPVTGIITTIAGNGDAVSAGDGGLATSGSFELPLAIAGDSAGNVFVVDAGVSSRIRRIDAVTGIITTVAGGGDNPPGAGLATDVNLGSDTITLAVNNAGTLFLSSGNRVFKVNLTTGQLSPFAGAASAGGTGDGGPALAARFNNIQGLTLAPGGGLLISDLSNGRIRYIVPDSINLAADSHQTEFSLPWVSALSGDLIVSGNPNLTTIDAGTVTSVSGTVDISDNDSATTIDLGSLNSANNVDISENDVAVTIDLGSLASATGSVSVKGNTAATVINLAVLTSAGSISVDGNWFASLGRQSKLAEAVDEAILGRISPCLHIVYVFAFRYQRPPLELRRFSWSCKQNTATKVHRV